VGQAASPDKTTVFLVNDIPEIRAAILAMENLFDHAMRPTPPETLGIEMRDQVHALAIVIEAAKEVLRKTEERPRKT
jgi:hypothetical protein